MKDQQLEDRLMAWHRSREKYDWKAECAKVRERRAKGLPVVYRMGVGYMDETDEGVA